MAASCRCRMRESKWRSCDAGGGSRSRVSLHLKPNCGNTIRVQPRSFSTFFCYTALRWLLENFQQFLLRHKTLQSSTLPPCGDGAQRGGRGFKGKIRRSELKRDLKCLESIISIPTNKWDWNAKLVLEKKNHLKRQNDFVSLKSGGELRPRFLKPVKINGTLEMMWGLINIHTHAQIIRFIRKPFYFCTVNFDIFTVNFTWL